MVGRVSQPKIPLLGTTFLEILANSAYIQVLTPQQVLVSRVSQPKLPLLGTTFSEILASSAYIQVFTAQPVWLVG